MNHDSRLMKYVPAGVVLAAAVFLGLTHEKVHDIGMLYLIGCGAVVALLAVADLDYRGKPRGRGSR